MSGACKFVPMRACADPAGAVTGAGIGAATGAGTMVMAMGADGAAGAGIGMVVGTPIAATARACSAAETVTVCLCTGAGGVAAYRGPGTNMDAGGAAAVGPLLRGAACAAVVAGLVLLSQPDRAIACSTSVCASALLASIVSTSRAFWRTHNHEPVASQPRAACSISSR